MSANHQRTVASVVVFIAILLVPTFELVAQTTSSTNLLAGGARAVSLGGAFVAISDNYAAPYWNPAGLVRIPRISSGYMATPLFGPWGNLQHGGIAYRVPNQLVNMGLGLNAIFLTSSEINGLQKNSYLTSFALGTASGSYEWHIGATMKLIDRKAGADEASSFHLDVGTLVSLQNSLFLGVVAKNLFFNSFEWTSGISGHVPQSLQVGIAGNLLNDAVTLTLQSAVTEGFATRSGMEVDIDQLVTTHLAPVHPTIRLGFRTASPEAIIPHIGFGVRFSYVYLNSAWVIHLNEADSIWLSTKLQF